MIASATDAAIDPVVRTIVEAAARRLTLRRVVLFGSRARGDSRPNSDIDLAFEHDSDDAAWADFVTDMQETAPTLLDLDLLDLRSASPELRARVTTEGKVVYGGP